jgi:hypothetical protein
VQTYRKSVKQLSEISYKEKLYTNLYFFARGIRIDHTDEIGEVCNMNREVN